MKWLLGVDCRPRSRYACYGTGLRPQSGMRSCLCVIYICLMPMTIVSTAHSPPTVATNFTSEEFHPAQLLSSSSLSSASLSTNENVIHGEEIQEKEVLYHFFRNGRNRSDFRKPSTTFMVSLFNELQRGGGLTSNDSVGTTTDTIRSFSGQSFKRTRRNRPAVDFYIPHLPSHEKLKRAEIRFLRNQMNKTMSRKYKFRIDVMKGGKTVKRIVLRGRSDPQSQHDVFDVTKIASPWINSFHGNIIFHVKVSNKFQSQTMAALKDIPLQSMSLIVLYLEDNDFLTNMYASLTSEESIHSAKSATKKKRTVFDSYNLFTNSSSNFTLPWNSKIDLTGRVRRSIPTRNVRNRKNKKWSSKSSNNDNCQMYDFEVDFNTIGWGQWIIHPKKFNARFCYGLCPSPIDVQYKPTNHAMLQTLMRMKRPLVAPLPCCVPTKLSPISMLYFEYDEIVVRHHEDMVASECGCR